MLFVIRKMVFRELQEGFTTERTRNQRVRSKLGTHFREWRERVNLLRGKFRRSHRSMWRFRQGCEENSQKTYGRVAELFSESRNNETNGSR